MSILGAGQPRPRLLYALALLGAVLTCLAVAVPARAEAPLLAHWKLDSRSAPTNLRFEREGGVGLLFVTVQNLGDGAVKAQSGKRVTITDTVPAGLEVTEVVGKNAPEGIQYSCSKGVPIKCEVPATQEVRPYDELAIVIRVKVKTEAPLEAENQVTVSGGEQPTGGPVPTATLGQPGLESNQPGRPIKVNGQETHFGVEDYELDAENEEFKPATQAGSHPFQLTTRFDLNQTLELNPQAKELEPGAPALPKDLSFDLPAGFIGDPTALGAQECTGAQFGSLDQEEVNSCPNDTAVGVAEVAVFDPIGPLFLPHPEPARIQPRSGSRRTGALGLRDLPHASHSQHRCSNR